VRLQIDNEYDRLEAVLVHRPGREIERLTHENMKYFLFEDIPYLRRMQDEHDAFVGEMRDKGVQVVYLEDLLLDVLRDEAVRVDLIEKVCQVAEMPALVEAFAGGQKFSDEELVEAFFAGLTVGEFDRRLGRSTTTADDEDNFLLRPMPNAYFARDPAVVVRDAIISAKMHYRVRIRESILTRAVLEHHPEFRDHAITFGGTREPSEDRPYTIEGGDVIILSPEAVLVGDSERTRSETIRKLAGKCFQFGRVKRVYEIPIPTERSFMHLDTVFTVLDRGLVLWYPEVMSKVKAIHRYEASPGDPAEAVRLPESRSFVDVLRDEFAMDVKIIDTGGGGRHFAKREQRADGTNAFAIAPRTAIVYERNERTIAALKEHGVTCIPIDDSELVRGLGGPRCMTMPLRRSPS
jgi:arginine deiminase